MGRQDTVRNSIPLIMSAGAYYDVLGVPANASDQMIRKAFLLRSKVLHPDRFNQKTQPKEWELANELLKQLNEAYSTLSDPGKRSEYDRLNANRASPSSASAPAKGRRLPSFFLAICVLLMAVLGLIIWSVGVSRSGQWSEFTLPGTKFTILAPGRLSDHPRELSTTLGPIKINDNWIMRDGVRFSLACYSYPQNTISTQYPGTLLDGLVRSAAEAVHGQVKDESDIFPGNKLSRKIIILMPDQGEIAILQAYCIDQDRAIVASVIGKTGLLPNLSTDRFFASIVFPDISNSPF